LGAHEADRLGLGSTIVPADVKRAATEDASPSAAVATSPAGPTLTSEPLATEGSPPPAEPPTAARQVRNPDRYHVLGEHGRGGLGRVSRAHDRELGRDVAIKELISRGHVSEVRFLREALITARLEHPGIVPVHEAGRWPDGTPFYAMKLVAGRPLRDLLAERITVDERIALLHHVIAVADAIAYAHGRRIIHRDLKPSNVIVGDFGETVVIDWGLAKDLTQAEDSAVGGESSGSSHDEDLTTAGTVLGTPAYMAPEQKRGEPVDQRADVFAIGAMLWGLCTIEKVPPDDPRERHAILRRGGIDQDLIAIIHKALAPDPDDRYPDAGALAADLKAFKAGARIAARRYSLWALLAHWTRRHRTLALSAAAVIAILIVGSVVYVRNVAAERDRADAALVRVEATQHALGVEHAELTLKHAQLLMTTDPSAAVDLLATYHGADRDRAAQLRAEAAGRGVSSLRAVPHTDSVLWLQGFADGSVVSLSSDGTISRTARNATSVVLARDVAAVGVGGFAYAASRHLLAYVCDPANLCLLDVAHGSPIAVPEQFRSSRPLGLAFSPGESQLATISGGGELRILDLAVPDRPVERLHVATGDGGGVLFIDEDAIAVGTRDGLALLHIGGPTQRLVDPDGTFWDADPSSHQLVLVTSRGQGYLAGIDPLRITTRVALCHDFVSGVKVIPGRRAVAYACREGTIGIWDLRDDKITPRAHLEGHANMLEVSAAGDYLVAAGDSGVLSVLDLETNLVSSFRGHGYRLTAISPPTAEYRALLSGDARGAIRAWPLPDRMTKMVGEVHTRVFSALFSDQAGMAIADTLDVTLTTFSAGKGVQNVGPHTPDTAYLEASAHGRRFAAYGASGVIELWSSSPLARTHVLDTQHGPVSRVAFLPGTEGAEDLVAAGRDGRLVRWTQAGEQRLVHEFGQPIDGLVVAARTGAIVISTRDGALWRIGDAGQRLALRPAGAKITRLLALPDGTSVCAGDAAGEVVVLDTTSWQTTVLPRAADAIRDIAVTADGRTIAIAANDNTVRVGFRHADAWTGPGTTWTELAMRARRLALTRDGLLVAICTDGTIWVYSAVRRTWLCLPVGTTDLNQVVVTGDGSAGTVFDTDGHIISLDLAAARKAVARL
jgi:WD40 repeat protein